MASMSYCRHENAASDLDQVWEEWEDYEEGSSKYEDRARVRIVKLVKEMHDQFEFDGTFDEVLS
jgi:hypothetical protein